MQVIDLTVPYKSSRKPSRKRTKVKRNLQVGLDSFINLCSDEEANPQPQKKRKFTTASEVIFISSDDEAEQSGGRLFVQRTSLSLEHAAEAPLSKDYFIGHPAPVTDSVASGAYAMKICHNDPDTSTTPGPTPPPVSPLENDGAEFPIPASQNIQGIAVSGLSQELLKALCQKSLQNSQAKSMTSEESSFRNARVSDPEKRFRKIVYKDKLAKPALLTSLFFARAMRSPETTRPKAIASPQSPSCSEANYLVESSCKEISVSSTSQLEFDKTEAPDHFSCAKDVPTTDSEVGFAESEPTQKQFPSTTPYHAAWSSTAMKERVTDILLPSNETSTRLETAQANVTHLCSPFRDIDQPSRVPSHELVVDINDGIVESQDDFLTPTSQILRTFDISPSVFEFEHLPNLTLQILFGSNNDPNKDSAISLPCYPERTDH